MEFHHVSVMLEEAVSGMSTAHLEVQATQRRS